jgi:hypothetical protein
LTVHAQIEEVIEIATGHDPMISAPTQLLDILEQAGRLQPG